MMRKLGLRVAVLIGAALPIMSASVGVAAADDPVVVQLVSDQSGMCMDVEGFSQEIEAKVWQWPCHGGANQRWELVYPDPAKEQVALRNVHSLKCLDLPRFNTANGTQLWQHNCHFQPNQLWEIQTAPNGSLALMNVESRKCVDLLGPGTEPRGPIVQWDCHYRVNQLWH